MIAIVATRVYVTRLPNGAVRADLAVITEEAGQQVRHHLVDVELPNHTEAWAAIDGAFRAFAVVEGT